MNEQRSFLDTTYYLVETFVEVCFDSFGVVRRAEVIRKEVCDEIGSSSHFCFQKIYLVEARRGKGSLSALKDRVFISEKAGQAYNRIREVRENQGDETMLDHKRRDSCILGCS